MTELNDEDPSWQPSISMTVALGILNAIAHMDWGTGDRRQRSVNPCEGGW